MPPEDEDDATLLETVGEYALALASDGRVARAGERLAEALGRAPDELRGGPVDAVVAGEDAAAFEAARARAASEGAASARARLRSDGPHLSWRLTRTASGGVVARAQVREVGEETTDTRDYAPLALPPPRRPSDAAPTRAARGGTDVDQPVGRWRLRSDDEPLALDVARFERRVPVTERLAVGRDPTCEVVVDDPAVSRRHAEVLPDADGLVVVDCGSTNGTLVNGREIAGPTRVTAGDRIGVGSFLLVATGAAEASPLGDLVQGTLDSLTAHVAVLDAQGTIVGVNAAWVRFARQGASPLPDGGLGRSHRDACPREACPRDACPSPAAPEPCAACQGIDDVLAGRRSVLRLEQAVSAGASPRWVTLHAARFGAGGERWVVVSREDVTDRVLAARELRQSRSQLRAILDSIPDLTWLKDREGRVVAANAALARLVGRSVDELSGGGARDEDLWPAPRAALHAREAGEVLRTGTATVVEGPVDDPGGATRWVETVTSPWLDEHGNVAGTASVARDLTQRRRAEQAVAASEARLRALLSALTDHAILTLSAAGRIEAWEAGAPTVFGHVAAEALGQDAGALLGEPIAAGLARGADATEATGWLRRKCGQRFWASFTLYGIADGGGERRFVVVVRDDSERESARALRESEARLRAVTESAHDAIVTATPEGRVVGWNRGAEALFGHGPAEACALGLDDLVEPGARPLLAAAAGAATAAARPLELVARRRDGTLVPVEVSLAAWEAGGERFLTGIFRDVTERRRAADALRRSGAELARANAELQRAARLKDEFLATVSHELRTPLTAILGLSESLEDAVYGPLGEKARDAAARIGESGRHLLALINDVLDMSKLDAGRVALEKVPVGVPALVASCVDLVAEAARRKRVSLTTTLDPQVAVVVADERRLKQILLNLLGNAVKFTPDGGAVGVAVEGVGEDDVVRFVVWDTGIGIAREDLGRLFRPFVQLDAGLARRHEGTGLGLALVRRLTELHGGSVHVESEPGAGSRFVVVLPWSGTSTPPQPGTPALGTPVPERGLEREGGDPRTLAALECDPALLALVREVADGLGARSIAPEPGAPAFPTAAGGDVVVLDARHPAGRAVLEQLGRDGRTRRKAVVVVAAPGDVARVEASHVRLEPPLTAERLREALAAAGPPRLEPVAPDRPVVLLAEDNPANVETIEGYLTARGYDVRVARDGLRAVELAAEVLPAAVIMDVQLPVLDGLEATRRIRSDPRLAAVPVIALTALAMPGDRERCLAAGATEYMTKPVGLRALTAALDELIRRG